MRRSIISLLLTLVSFVGALSSSGNRLLVVLEDASQKDLYSKLWTDVKGRGYTLSFESPKNDKLALFELGERAYDHVLLLPPTSKAYGPALSGKNLLDFINAEGNILLTLTSEHPTSAAINSLLLELDINISPDRHSLVVDHFNYDASSSPENHNVLVVQTPKSIRPDVKNFFGGAQPIAVPNAVAQVLGNGSPLLAPILRAPSTAYVHNPKDDAESAEDVFAAGSQISLASAMQARNSARFVVFGSAEALQDKWFDASVQSDGKTTTTGNRQFAKQLTSWAFKETGVIKFGRLQHHLKQVNESLIKESLYPAGELNPKIYRIKNEVTYTIELSEYDQDHLAPFTPPSSDAIQLEVTMLSPFHRLTLKPIGTTANSTLYSTSFKLPDQHGIFNFRVNYKRPFYTNIDEKRQVTVRHFAHDEWPRSWEISGAWTWIAGIWVTVAGWIAFVAVWLYSAPVRDSKSVKKIQ